MYKYKYIYIYCIEREREIGYTCTFIYIYICMNIKMKIYACVCVCVCIFKVGSGVDEVRGNVESVSPLLMRLLRSGRGEEEKGEPSLWIAVSRSSHEARRAYLESKRETELSCIC